MKLLAQDIPGIKDILQSSPVQGNFPLGTLGELLSNTFNLVFFIAGFLLVFWLAWGVFQYIFAGGNKEGLGKARQRITYAIIGFIIVILAFALSQYLATIFPQNPSLKPAQIIFPKP